MKYIITTITAIFSFIAINAQKIVPNDMSLHTIEPTPIVWTIENIADNIAGMELFNTIDDNADREPTLVERLADFASQFIGRRYRLGATGPKSFDCSGFTSYVFRHIGVELNRTSRMQYSQGDAIDDGNLRPGDLMFFSTPKSGKGRVGHVGIVVDVDDENNNLTFIHASTSKGVTYQTFPDNGYFSRHYIGAKRVIA